MNKKQTVDAMARRTGLTRATIKDLMKHGWFYDEDALLTKNPQNIRLSFTKKVNLDLENANA